ncbi:G protein-activated inward rectifier potassium channel 3-like [Portunus trituberculatus]|uniref:G protein-activated inward rectifier potassium channel 3-like n=1 Tax=Portunus trituberculatus TaxID=210409 RepID=UPI001E1CBA28|nr:G protein-activated inward rectifier potassium channel 3-like [Portunus trituberculatus]XP_045124981.1 G protein-activated inward rectifier potassium channel 3-like [Portunus trituberculatus]
MEGVDVQDQVPPRLQGLVNGQAPLAEEDEDQEPTPLTAVPPPACVRSRVLNPGSRHYIIRRNGDINLTYANLRQRRSRYLQDLYTTLVDVQWRWTLLVFFLGFIISWLCFAFIWYMIIKVHGDDQEDSDHPPCINNVQTFTGSFLFSIETQHTIGYGYRYITEECPEAVLIMCIQSITGVILQAFMVGVVFAKLTRAKQRSNTIIFSRQACICLRDGNLCLLFRIGDMRKSFIIGASVMAQVVRRRSTDEGEVIPFHQYDVTVGSDDGSEKLFFIWPMTIVHVINQNSPFYNMSAVDLMNENFELVVYLEGTTESTGNTMQARFSYQPSDILWGHRFENMISFDKSSDNYAVDFREFNKTREIPTPLCSARELEEFKLQSTEPLMHYTPSGNDPVVCLEPNVFLTHEQQQRAQTHSPM